MNRVEPALTYVATAAGSMLLLFLLLLQLLFCAHSCSILRYTVERFPRCSSRAAPECRQPGHVCIVLCFRASFFPCFECCHPDCCCSFVTGSEQLSRTLMLYHHFPLLFLPVFSPPSGDGLLLFHLYTCLPADCCFCCCCCSSSSSTRKWFHFRLMVPGCA